MKIDQTDIKILRFLLKEARTSFTTIAKECKTSTEVVRIRYKNMKKAGIITGSIIKVLPTKIGLGIIGKLTLETKKNSNSLINNLKEKPNILSVWKDQMDQTLNAYFALPDNQALNQLTSILINHPNILSVNTRLDTPIPFEFPTNLVIKPYKTKKRYSTVNNETMQWWNTEVDIPKKVQTPELSKINPTERKIAKTLAYNARLPLSDIAKHQNISLTKVKRIYQKLKKTIFGNSSITINLQKLGYNAGVEFSIEISPGSNYEEISNKILKIPNMVVLVKIVGKANFLGATPVKDLLEFFNLKKQLIEIKGIKKVESKISQIIPSFPTNMIAAIL